VRSSLTERAATYTILIVFSILAITPILQILFAAFESQTSLSTGFTVPTTFHWSNFVDAWTQGHFSAYLRSSLIVSVVVVAVSTVVSTLAAYAFGTMRFPGSTVVFYLFIIGLTVPEEALVIPLYYDFRGFGLTDTYAALILPQIAMSVSFGTYWMRAYFRGSSRTLMESARLDGAGSWRILWRILLPVGRPAVLTLIVITFMWTWNEFLLALVMVTSDSKRTVPLGLAFFQGQYSSNVPLLAAASVLVALPVVVVYLIFQRNFIAGMLSGAVKE
jgi:raffinose/stachyose/melibiose transport system permease protein